MQAFTTARDPALSLLQSAAAAIARSRGADLKRGPLAHPLTAAVADLVATCRNGSTIAPLPGTDLAGDCVSLGLALLQAEFAGFPARRQELLDRLRYSNCDPLWAETLLDYVRNLGPDGRPASVPYVRYETFSDFVITAPQSSMRVGLISDWGTGTDAALAVAALLATKQPDVVIHLGDIYYAGTPQECSVNFLAPLREVLPHTRLFTLCGNHDVYSGGAGYYDLLDRIGQPASYFCLRSPDRLWQILGADTGLHDRDPFDESAALTSLDPQEELWHTDKLRGFSGRTLLLTHHQPFSAFSRIGPRGGGDPTNPNLMATHARLSRAGRIDGWFWGHEHSLRFYAPYRGVLAGRNVGNGAIPVAAGSDAMLTSLRDPPELAANPTLDQVDGAYAHGFALLDLSPNGVDASYWITTRPGTPVHAERIAGRPDAASSA